MHPENVLLPLTYGAASVLTIGCLSMCVIALFGATFAVAASRSRTGYFRLRAGSAWISLALWVGLTGWIASAYRDGYHAAATALGSQRPAPTEAAANTAIIAAANPTVWAVKTILLLIIGGFLWVGTTRTRAAAALLLAHSRGPVDPVPVRQVAKVKIGAAAADPAVL